MKGEKGGSVVPFKIGCYRFRESFEKGGQRCLGTTGDLCSDGECVGSVLDCNDGKACTEDTCEDGLCLNSITGDATAKCHLGNVWLVNACGVPLEKLEACVDCPCEAGACAVDCDTGDPTPPLEPIADGSNTGGEPPDENPTTENTGEKSSGCQVHNGPGGSNSHWGVCLMWLLMLGALRVSRQTSAPKAQTSA